LAALEIALIAKPDDPILRRQLAQTQWSAGLPQAALATIAPLLDDPPADPALVELAARIAGDAGDFARGRAWLAAVPADTRTRSQRLLAARLALEAQDPVSATAALKELIALGERDAAVLTWAGQAAEQANDQAAAESFYAQAVHSGASPATASLRLVALYLKQKRSDDAQSLLASHLAKHPDDGQAKALLAQLAHPNK
jgi:predicted Zn-dependent protease